jgi:hypothetical protein
MLSFLLRRTSQALNPPRVLQENKEKENLKGVGIFWAAKKQTINPQKSTKTHKDEKSGVLASFAWPIRVRGPPAGLGPAAASRGGLQEWEVRVQESCASLSSLRDKYTKTERFYRITSLS